MWSRPARPATSAPPAWLRGGSPSCNTSPNETAGRSSSPCRTSTTSSTAVRSWKCSVCWRTRVSAASRGARSRKASSPGRGATRPLTGALGARTAWAAPLWLDTDQAIIDAIQRIAEARRVSMAQVALAWVLKNPAVDAPIVGVTKQHHLVDAAAALDLELTVDEVTALEEPYVLRQATWF